MQTRRNTLAALALTVSAPALLSACGGEATPVTSDDVTLGDPNAPVTVIEYHSVACPVCARWALEVWPTFKSRYIDTGEVYYISREMLIHNPAMAAAGFLIARCAGEDAYFDVVHEIYEAQTEMEMSGAIREGLLGIARRHGINEEAFNACTQDAAAIEAMQDRYNGYIAQGYRSTPTFVVNGRELVGFVDLATLEQAIENAEPAAAQGPAETPVEEPAAASESSGG